MVITAAKLSNIENKKTSSILPHQHETILSDDIIVRYILFIGNSR